MGEAEERAFDAMFVVGPLGIIEGVDENACRLLGYSLAELLGMHGSQLVKVEQRPQTAVSIDRMRRGEIVASQGRLLRKDGGEIAVDVRSRALPEGRIGLSVRSCVTPRSRSDSEPR